MQIRRIRVEKFRKLEAPVEIAGLPPGLAVIGGDNEEGKSTLLEAVRSALFDKHSLSGQAASAMQPSGQKLAPEVELDFSFGGREYRLWKRFCQKPAARLEGPEGALEDDAAEDALQDLLGFERPGRGASDLPHHGIWGLLWVSQGSTFEPVAPGEGARRALGEVLEDDVGEVLGGALGQELLHRFAEWHARFWGKTGKPVQELKKAEDSRQAAAEALESVRAQLDRYDDQLGQLERVERELTSFRQEDRRAEMRRRLEAARSRQQEVERLQATLKEAQTRGETTAARLQEIEGRWTTRRELQQEAEQTRAKAAELEQQGASVRAEVQRLEQALDGERKALEAAEGARDQARERERRLGLLIQRRQAEAELRRLAGQMDKAQAARKEAQEARLEADRIAVDDEALQGLRELEQELGRAEARLSAAATEVDLEVEVAHRMAGEAEERGPGYLVTGRATLELDGVGRIVIRAGGTELPDLQGAVGRTRSRRDARLVELDVSDIGEAEGRVTRRRELLALAGSREQVQAAHAPDGIEALRARTEELAAALDRLPDAGGEEAPDDDSLRSRHEQARAERERTEQAAADAGRGMAERRQQLQAARERLTDSGGRLREVAAQAERTEERLARARAELADDELARRVTERRAGQEAADADLRMAREAVAALDPEEVRRRLEDAERAVEQTDRQLSELETRHGELRAALRALGHQGLAEQAAELERKAAEAERRHRAVEREARAVWLAAGALEEAARSAREAYLQPLIRHLRPYLEALFPGAEPVIGDDLRIEGLARGREERFEQLSIGAREQVAVLTRLAFADLLAETGEPPPVILDDALVYADENRFETMKTLLSRSARRHQVLILTCRPREYLSLGAEQFRLYG